ncbi:uncharacterized protein LOC117108086, partial [Anneissia japonica]|uniref:uncharacterized protein LOC117108086 n=1 Tax=Anneissia japonica TaxID=1529436 RepID=UPI0014258DAE
MHTELVDRRWENNRHIIAKFIHRPQRREVLIRAKSVLRSSDMFVTKDLPQADVIKKRSLKIIMDQAYKEGKRPVFKNGNLYISGGAYGTTTPEQTYVRPWQTFIELLIILPYATHWMYDLEFMLLSEINRPTNADLEWWKYDKFKLETLSNDECNAYFRFFKEDIHHLKDVFHIPDQVKCRNNSKIEGIEALCIMLQRYAYPCRYVDIIKTFARPVPQLCLITGQMTNHIYNMFGRLLTDLDQPWLSPVNLE